jgi:hypothetical protein
MALPMLTSHRSFLVLAVLLVSAQENFGALLLQALQGTCPHFNHNPMRPSARASGPLRRPVVVLLAFWPLLLPASGKPSDGHWHNGR